MPANPTVSFVIPVRNDAARLRRCLGSIVSNDAPGDGLELIVADNGSTDDSPAVAVELGATVIPLPGLPVARMRNEAAARAQGSVLAFVDADHEVSSCWLGAALAALEQTGAAAVGSHYQSPPGATWVQRAYDRFRPRTRGRADADWLGSGNLAIRAEVFRAIGGFDESLESCEDVDLCNRLRWRGHRLVSEPRMVSVHHGDPATLRALFLSELWRGRDNVRVTLRGPLTLRALPSLVIPLGNLAALLGAIPLALLGRNPLWLLLPVLTLGGSTVLRAVRMAADAQGSEEDTARRLKPARYREKSRVLLENLAVAGVYELARAVALLVRASHKTRRGA
jgi:GT2 family glycosyltransferase